MSNPPRLTSDAVNAIREPSQLVFGPGSGDARLLLDLIAVDRAHDLVLVDAVRRSAQSPRG